MTRLTLRLYEAPPVRGVVKVVIRELREGSNAIQFPIPSERLNEIVADQDDLYSATTPGSVDLDLQKYSGLMHLSGTVAADISFDCARCLASRPRSLHIGIQWTLIPRPVGEKLSAEEEVELSDDDLNTSYYEGEEIDLGELAREAILLELDPIPSCGPDEDCVPAVEITVVDPNARAEDPRWAPLKKMLAERESND